MFRERSKNWWITKHRKEWILWFFLILRPCTQNHVETVMKQVTRWIEHECWTMNLSGWDSGHFRGRNGKKSLSNKVWSVINWSRFYCTTSCLFVRTLRNIWTFQDCLLTVGALYGVKYMCTNNIPIEHLWYWALSKFWQCQESSSPVAYDSFIWKYFVGRPGYLRVYFTHDIFQISVVKRWEYVVIWSNNVENWLEIAKAIWRTPICLNRLVFNDTIFPLEEDGTHEEVFDEDVTSVLGVHLGFVPFLFQLTKFFFS